MGRACVNGSVRWETDGEDGGEGGGAIDGRGVVVAAQGGGDTNIRRCWTASSIPGQHKHLFYKGVSCSPLLRVAT
ncbi:hypothetical protein B296_00022980 [Ensete ventricosum]|uniref:Uncharacterized protein n=1 Tax=Ensete ventricosum TaxID=4639 RepID=A0A426ZV66_ENSVE|nr:hypothetical protein B296_00022980 [Ensete ventricosum]